MNAVGILMNYKDKHQRAGYPTGLLLLYKETQQLLALSRSPLSETLLRAWLDGIEFTRKDVFFRYEQVSASGKKPLEFVSKAVEYFSRSGFTVTTDEVSLPLAEILHLTEDLKFTSAENSFETLPLKGLT